MEDEDHIELQLLPNMVASSSRTTSDQTSSDPSLKHRRSRNSLNIPSPSLDLQLSISLLNPFHQQQPQQQRQQRQFEFEKPDNGGIQALKWQAAEQIRLAALEKAYAERVRELTRREMELAQSEFARARHVWERARQEVERAEKLKERATRRIDDPACLVEITCHSCRQRFRP